VGAYLTGLALKPVPIERGDVERLLERFLGGEALQAWDDAGERRLGAAARRARTIVGDAEAGSAVYGLAIYRGSNTIAIAP
jgi:hypothetical protein